MLMSSGRPAVPRSRPRRRKATPQVRRDSGYTILEAMPPLIACGFLGSVIAAGLMIQSPATGVDSNASDTSHQVTHAGPDTAPTDPANHNASKNLDDRPTPATAERR